MNLLAHIFLSGDNELIRIGNFMADGIRGKEYKLFPEDIQKGILLHREIDTFTDAHPYFRKSTKRLHVNYHHYSGVIVDVFYDHFLAKNWQLYSDVLLEDYSNSFYQSMENHKEHLTPKTLQMLPVIKKYNWLLMYASVDGISTILTQMDHRTSNKSNMRFSKKDLLENYESFEEEFTAFFQEVQEFAVHKRLQL